MYVQSSTSSSDKRLPEDSDLWPKHAGEFTCMYDLCLYVNCVHLYVCVCVCVCVTMNVTLYKDVTSRISVFISLHFGTSCTFGFRVEYVGSRFV